MSTSMLHLSKSLIAFICSVNFMFLCSYCAILGNSKGRLGDLSCKTERDCVANAYCLDARYCSCYDNFVEDTSTGTCVPKPLKIGDICNIDIQCTSSFGTRAYCFKNQLNESGHCRCFENSHYQDGLCYESVELGGPCKVSDNCISTSNVPTYCAHSVCVCAATYHPSDNRKDCLPDIVLGGKCRKDEDCITDHSYCAQVCSCQSGYVVGKDGISCLSAAKNLRAQCKDDLQCQRYLSNTICDTQNNQCKCAPFSHEVDNSCWMSAKLGEACSNPNQCTTPSRNRSTVSCQQGRCACGDGYTRVDFDCTQIKDVSAESSPLEKCVFLTIAAVILGLHND